MPCNCEVTDAGECVKFDTKQLFKVLIIANKLDSIRWIQSLVFAIISDGTKINNNLH